MVVEQQQQQQTGDDDRDCTITSITLIDVSFVVWRFDCHPFVFYYIVSYHTTLPIQEDI